MKHYPMYKTYKGYDIDLHTGDDGSCNCEVYKEGNYIDCTELHETAKQAVSEARTIINKETT